MLTFERLGKWGRFGNGMFQIAGVIGLATKHGYAYGFPEWKNYDHAERFGSQEDIDLQKYFVHPLPRIDNAKSYPEFSNPWGWHDNLSIPDNVSLFGHFQSDRYFEHCIDTVRHYFTMKDEPPMRDVVAVHVRLGDYDDNYHPRLTMDYYAKAMTQFPEGTEFMLFSDDIERAYEMFSGSKYPSQDQKPDYIQDFKIMKRCKHFITGNSSYSLMASILGDHPDKKIVCPSNWWGPAWGANHKELCKDVYPKNAIVI